MADKIRATYNARRRAFELDEAGAELGQKNEDDQDFNRSKVHQRDLGDLSIVATLPRVEYGSWDGKSACLVTFSFSFDSGNVKSCRFTSARIIIEFTSREADSSDPIVVNYGPKRLLGQKTEENRRWLYAGEFEAKASIGPFEVGPTLRAESEGFFTRTYMEVIKANSWGDKSHKCPNTVKYWLKENKRQQGGIPEQLNATIVVIYEGPFQAVVDVSSTVIFDILAQPWTKDDPVLFEPGIEVGPPVRDSRDSEFSTLNEEDWRRIVTSNLDDQ